METWVPFSRKDFPEFAFGEFRTPWKKIPGFQIWNGGHFWTGKFTIGQNGKKTKTPGKTNGIGPRGWLHLGQTLLETPFLFPHTGGFGNTIGRRGKLLHSLGGHYPRPRDWEDCPIRVSQWLLGLGGFGPFWRPKLGPGQKNGWPTIGVSCPGRGAFTRVSPFFGTFFTPGGPEEPWFPNKGVVKSGGIPRKYPLLGDNFGPKFSKRRDPPPPGGFLGRPHLGGTRRDLLEIIEPPRFFMHPEQGRIFYAEQ